ALPRRTATRRVRKRPRNKSSSDQHLRDRELKKLPEPLHALPADGGESAQRKGRRCNDAPQPDAIACRRISNPHLNISRRAPAPGSGPIGAPGSEPSLGGTSLRYSEGRGGLIFASFRECRSAAQREGRRCNDTLQPDASACRLISNPH